MCVKLPLDRQFLLFRSCASGGMFEAGRNYSLPGVKMLWLSSEIIKNKQDDALSNPLET